MKEVEIIVILFFPSSKQYVSTEYLNGSTPPPPTPCHCHRLLCQCFPFQHPLISAIAFVTMETGLAASLTGSGVGGFFTIARLTAPVAAAGQRDHRAQNQPLRDTKKPSVCPPPQPPPPQVRLTPLLSPTSSFYSHRYGLRDYITTATVWAS